MTLSDQIAAKVELAQTYFEDGAPRAAARCLREAAELLDQAAEQRDAFLAEAVG